MNVNVHEGASRRTAHALLGRNFSRGVPADESTVPTPRAGCRSSLGRAPRPPFSKHAPAPGRSSPYRSVVRRIPVDSSSLKSVGYLESEQRLEVEFISGKVYDSGQSHQSGAARGDTDSSRC